MTVDPSILIRATEGIRANMSKSQQAKLYDEIMRSMIENGIKEGFNGNSLPLLDARNWLEEQGFDKELQTELTERWDAIAADSIAALTPNVNKSEADLLLKQTRADVAVGAIQTGVGLIQTLRGVAKRNNLKEPKLPPELRKNSRLQTEITKAVFRADNVDPAQRTLFEGRIAEAERIANQNSRASGQVGQFAANQQASQKMWYSVCRSLIKNGTDNGIVYATDSSHRRDWFCRQKIVGSLGQCYCHHAKC